MQRLPFSITSRANSPFYYVRFRNETTGKFLSWKSTKETNYNRAVRKAWEMYNSLSRTEELQTLSFYDTIKKSDYTKEDVLQFLNDFQKRGFISSWVMNDESTNNEEALPWLLKFWNPAESDYLKERERKKKPVHTRHIENSQGYIKNYWQDVLQNKKLGSICRSDIKLMFRKLDDLALNGNTKNHILRAVLTPLKWAYNNELIQKDVSSGWTFYTPEYKKRAILTKEMANAVFKVDWGSRSAKVAAMLSMVSGMRIGEIQALRLEDVGDDFIAVNHNWTEKDGLKSPKNGEARKVFVPFPFIISELRNFGRSNPFTSGAGFIFFGKVPDKPIDNKTFRKYFRRALVSAGMDQQEANTFSFHSWRHFYTTYMLDRVSEKSLQTQTGHKTREMLEHYADHQTLEEMKVIMSAQSEAFGALVQHIPSNHDEAF